MNRTTRKLLCLGVLAATAAAAPVEPPEKPSAAEGAAPAGDARQEVSRLKLELARQLLAIRRVHVEPLGGGEAAQQIRDMLVAALQETGLFVLTEDPERADATLRGSGEDLVYTDTFQSSERIGGRGAVSLPAGGANQRYANRTSASVGFDEGESVRKTERKHESSASVRLFNKEGDVIWSTIQQSGGGKFDSASADVAKRVAKALAEHYRQAERMVDPAAVSAPSVN
jgi:hypothetical protein